MSRAGDSCDWLIPKKSPSLRYAHLQDFFNAAVETGRKSNLQTENVKSKKNMPQNHLNKLQIKSQIQLLEGREEGFWFCLQTDVEFNKSFPTTYDLSCYRILPEVQFVVTELFAVALVMCLCLLILIVD